MPDSFSLALGKYAHQSVPLPAFTFGGRAKLIVVVAPTDEDGQVHEGRTIHLRESDGVWWALRDETDQQGRRILKHEWLLAPLTNRSNLDIDPGIGEDQGLLKGYIEIQMGSNIFGHQDMRAVADLDQQQLLTQTFQIPISRGDLSKIEKALQASIATRLDEIFRVKE